MSTTSSDEAAISLNTHVAWTLKASWRSEKRRNTSQQKDRRHTGSRSRIRRTLKRRAVRKCLMNSPAESTHRFEYSEMRKRLIPLFLGILVMFTGILWYWIHFNRVTHGGTFFPFTDTVGPPLGARILFGSGLLLFVTGIIGVLFRIMDKLPSGQQQ